MLGGVDSSILESRLAETTTPHNLVQTGREQVPLS